MEQNFDVVEKSNKTMPIIIGILGALYGISPVDLVPDVIPIAGWLDDVVVTGGALLGVAQAYIKDTNVFFASLLGIAKWILWILGGILITLIAFLGVTIYGLFS